MGRGGLEGGGSKGRVGVKVGVAWSGEQRSRWGRGEVGVEARG